MPHTRYQRSAGEPAAGSPITDSPGARFARARLPLSRAAVGLAACALAAAIIGWRQSQSVVSMDVLGWPQVLVAAGLMLLCCGGQALMWQLVASGRATAQRGSGLRRLSGGLHLVSYALVILGLYGSASLVVNDSVESASLPLVVVTVLALVSAQILGGADFVRDGGPGGNIPDHIRRVSEFDRQRRLDPPDDEDRG